MRVLAISFPAWVLVGLALAREVPSSQNANSIENSPGLPINEVKHSNIKEQFRHEGNAIDWETLDKHDEDVGDDDNEKQEPVMPDEVLGDAKDTDWDNLEDSDEFLFTKDTTSVRKVPKNSKASDDIFYFQPLNIASYQPGEVIRMRK
ncbi:hypothetical protein JCM33374_g6286 [Metschnikowia sp. JCM 33374]|nr:hypothetical protein JCM33374_g6286 [Metschnikowia sp. JCM 33374]